MVLDPEWTLFEKKARVEQILRVLSRHGLLYDALDAGPEWLSALHLPKPDPALAAMPLADKLSATAIELGPTFVKIGQILGTRPDVVGPTAAAALSSLQADVPAEPFEMIRTQVESELGKPLTKAFGSFDPVPVGAASVGQVHSATLPDGTGVVVKVLRTGIEGIVGDDLAILTALAQIASKSTRVARYRPAEVMDELAHALTQELNLRREASNLAKFIRNFAGQTNVVFPQPVAGLCTQRVLTETQLPGSPMSRQMAELSDDEKLEFVKVGVGVYLDMVFRDNLFHGDPHAGNLFWGPPAAGAAAADPVPAAVPPAAQSQPDTTPDDTPQEDTPHDDAAQGAAPAPQAAAGWQLGIIDFGEVGRLDPQVLDQFEVIILAVVAQDNDRLIDALLELCNAPARLDRKAFRRDVNDWVDDYFSMGAAGGDMSGAITAVLGILRQYDMTLPPDLALLVKALLQLQGLLVSTGLKVKLFDFVAPYSRKIIMHRLAPQRVAREMAGTARGWSRFLQHTPGDLEDIVAAVRRGELELPFQVKGLDRPVNRLVAAMLLAAMVRGSSEMWAKRAEPAVAGISLPGAFGTAVSVLGTVRLLRALGKSGGM